MRFDHREMRGLLAAAVVSGLVGHASLAHACSGGGCLQPGFAPSNGRAIPATVRGLVYYRSLASGILVGNPVFELLDSAGKAVPFSLTPDASSLLGPVLVVPDALLEEGGSYRFRATDV